MSLSSYSNSTSAPSTSNENKLEINVEKSLEINVEKIFKNGLTEIITILKLQSAAIGNLNEKMTAMELTIGDLKKGCSFQE